jgi:hypothetical protein
MPTNPSPLVIADLRGGLNTEDSPFSLPADQVVLCENMDLGRGTIGGRRLGHSAVTTSGDLGATPFMHRHLPTQDETASELWRVTVSGTTSAWHRKTSAWSAVSVTGAKALDVAQGKYRIRAASVHGKMFLAYPTVSGTDRLHVWDGTSVRVSGLAEPAAPSVANQGSGSLTGLRYYRVRYTEQVSSVTVRRSEPSDSASITPSGTGQYVRVTKPAAISEGETHWEIEASTDNVLFYRIATVAVGTTTYDDASTTTQITADETLLSADIGDYSLIHNPKFLSVDQDRLLVAGSWEQPALASRVAWTPVYGAPGVGNDERFEDDTDPFLDLDGFDGGELTDFAGPLFGYHVAYKRKRIYKIVRTYARAQAYQAIPLTDAFGAITGSVVKGVDEAGRPCHYFLDWDMGPCRIGANGVERCGATIHATWLETNRDADLVAWGLFYPDEMQVWWYLAEAGQETPTRRIKLHIEEQTAGRQGAERGWSIDTGPYMAALCGILYADNIEDDTTRSVTLKPLVGTAITGAEIAMANTGFTDNGTEYQARVRTKPYLPAGMFGEFKIRTATLTAEAAEADVSVTLIRDYGKEQLERRVSLRPSEADETHVIVPLEDCQMGEIRALQVELGDAEPAASDWVLEAIAFLPQSGLSQ